MKRRSLFGCDLGEACATGCRVVAPREIADPRPWNLKGGILARTGQVAPSPRPALPGY